MYKWKVIDNIFRPQKVKLHLMIILWLQQLNFNSAAVEVWEWISNLIPYVTVHMITYTCWYLS